jgi:hypothetical protein
MVIGETIQTPRCIAVSVKIAKLDGSGTGTMSTVFNDTYGPYLITV